MLKDRINEFYQLLGNSDQVTVKEFYIGEDREKVEAVIIFILRLVDVKRIDTELLSPLMNNAKVRGMKKDETFVSELCKKYLPMSTIQITKEKSKIAHLMKRGSAVILIDNVEESIIANVEGGEYRSIKEPTDEVSIGGTKESFIENLDTNVTILKRALKDKNLTIDKLTVGERSQTDVAVLYLKDVADMKVVNEIKKQISEINTDIIYSTGQFIQFLNINEYSIFPQIYSTERIDTVLSDLAQGRASIVIEGTSYVCTAPSLFIDFFQGVEDYNQLPIIGSFNRILRLLAFVILTTLSALYLTLLEYNSELLPSDFATAIIQSRKEIELTPFMEIIFMQISVDFLREGGLRLPRKISQTLSVVGGIIIGDAVIRGKIVSPTTLLVVGIATIATFLIPNYEMASALRILNYVMIGVANVLGIFGITIVWFFIIVHLSAIETFGVPYFAFSIQQMKDLFIRAPLKSMNKRSNSIPNKNPYRQKKKLQTNRDKPNK